MQLIISSTWAYLALTFSIKTLLDFVNLSRVFGPRLSEKTFFSFCLGRRPSLTFSAELCILKSLLTNEVDI